MDLRFDQQPAVGQDYEIELSNNWLITYSDMITIMLCFFMVFFILSASESDTLQELRLRLTAQVDDLDREVGRLTMENSRLLQEKQLLSQHLFGINHLQQDLSHSREDFISFLRDNDLMEQVQILDNERGLMIRFKDSVLFASGSAEVSPQGLELLEHIGRKLTEIPNPVVVEGYTDNVPISTAAYPSNWELSSARAITVARYLIYDLGVTEERLSVTGFGEQNPIDTNDTSTGRANNRRIEITVLTP
ncbi:OmpA/MotB family protein [Anoxynatronum buryatiense]|uniref:Chemotaxis protein MotB n=1 Tax=Anoxynatronum buryatiense TaxID=489973 RepID=A0AA45WXR9_9CLOT|nr:flagellar motor protein MotB [Anoxynatronum buryatiense]SMP65053.1 chemotaxis protein MotB [Anoxynatronum buryatiense]